jgi:hypothetical protein
MLPIEFRHQRPGFALGFVAAQAAVKFHDRRAFFELVSHQLVFCDSWVLPLLPIDTSNLARRAGGGLPLLPLDFFRHYWQ